jgi:hypothetical protein
MRQNTFVRVFFCNVFAAIALVGGRTSAGSKTSMSLIPVLSGSGRLSQILQRGLDLVSISSSILSMYSSASPQ